VVERLGPNLLSWASKLDQAIRDQALALSRSPAVAGPVVLMPDAHVGAGATIGTVLPTATAIIPSAVGADIGCGMAAVETDLAASDLPDA
jgi:tRNA-splicing ligase RtcB